MRFTRIVNVQISLNDELVIVSHRQIKKNVASPMLVGLTTFLMGLTLSSNAFADCGGYVNIGNKSKLRELQKEGFAFGPSMESHASQSQESDFQDSSARNSRSNPHHPDGRGRNIEERSSRPVPCTGSQCGSNPIPGRQPESIVLECLPLKPLKTSAVSYEKLAVDSYFGYSEYSETPFLFKLLIDRPPE